MAPKIVKDVFAAIKDINARRKIAIFIVEHNLKSVLDIAARAYVLKSGKIFTEGNAKCVVDSGLLEKAML